MRVGCYAWTLLCLAIVLPGCLEKRVTITTNPTGAQLTMQPIRGDEQTEPAAVGASPITQKLKFDNVQRYRVTATAPLHRSAELFIEYEPKEQLEYTLELEQFARELPLITFVPQRVNGHHVLHPRRTEMLAFLDVVERSPHVKAITRITANEDAAAIVGPPTMSPVEDVMVYEWIELDDRVIQYIANKGDTWQSIAERFEIEVSNLVATNPEADGKKIKDGQSIEVPLSTVKANIWRQDIGSFGKSRITEGRYRDLFPAFTGDGKNILFSSNRAGENAILWRIRTSGGGGITKVTDSNSEDFQPSASLDGKMIAYVSMPPGAEARQIWTVHTNGALPSQLAEGYSPQIAPDGQRILFLRPDDESGHAQIWLMNIDGTAETQLTQRRDHAIRHARWSPDGQWIVFASNLTDESANTASGVNEQVSRNFDIWIMSVDDGRKTRLTYNGSHDDGPTWDRTGKFIYFRSNRSGVWNIWRIEPAMGE